MPDLAAQTSRRSSMERKRIPIRMTRPLILALCLHGMLGALLAMELVPWQSSPVPRLRPADTTLATAEAPPEPLPAEDPPRSREDIEPVTEDVEPPPPAEFPSGAESEAEPAESIQTELEVAVLTTPLPIFQARTSHDLKPSEATPRPSATPPPASKTPPASLATMDAGLTRPAPREHDCPKPRYPRRAIKCRWEGTVRVRVHVAADGRPRRVEVLQSSGHPILDERVTRTILEDWTFDPALEGGVPVPGVWERSFVFKLRG